MKKRIAIRIAATLFALMIVLGNTNFTAKADNRDDLRAIEEKLAEYKQNASAQSEIADLLNQQLEVLDRQVRDTQAAIDNTTAQITQTQAQIDAMQIELDEATANLVSYQKQLEERMAVMYMYGNSGYLEVLFGSESFSDFISRATAISSIINYDNEIARKLKETEKLIEAKKAEIETAKATLETTLAEQKAAQQELADQEAEKQATMAEIRETEAYWTALAKQEEEEAAALRRIVAMESSNTDFANTYTTFIWPIPGEYSITSPFGWRIHPIYGYSKFHSGTDIGADWNDHIVAPANGRVILAEYYGGYGNCVILDLGCDTDGNQYKMLFAHMNALNVSEGQIVTQGEVIGFAGMTGTATGVHLHFEVIINGVEVEPMNYVLR